MQDTSAPCALFGECCVSICAGHRDSLGFALYGVDVRAARRRGRVGRDFGDAWGSDGFQVGFWMLWGALRFDGNRFWRRTGAFRRSCCGSWRCSSRLGASSTVCSGLAVIGVLEAIEAFICDADQLIGLFAILRESGHAVVHAHAHAELKRMDHLDKNGFDSPTHSQRLLGIRLWQEESEFVPPHAGSRVPSAEGLFSRSGGLP